MVIELSCQNIYKIKLQTFINNYDFTILFGSCIWEKHTFPPLTTEELIVQVL